MNENKPVITELTPEMVLAVLRDMPDVSSAEYRNGKFFAQTPEGTTEVEFFFPRKENEGTA